jgi:hypothetical protein
MEVIGVHIIDANGRDKGVRPVTITMRRMGGTVIGLDYAGEHYAYSRPGTNVKAGKAMSEFCAQGDALRLWLANDLSFAQED